MRLLVSGVVFAMAGAVATAQDVQPWGSRDFTSKRIGVPSSGQSGGLVQIDPTEEPYHLTPARPQGDHLTSTATTFDPDATAGWFWTSVGADIGAGSADRLKSALGHLTLADRKLAPTWKDLSRMVEAHGPDLTRTGETSRVSPALALAVMAVESSGRTDVTSKAGAQGLMQLMPATAQRFNVGDPFDAEQNIRGGVAYLDFLLKSFGDDPILALAAYNAGEGAVARHGGVPPYKETRVYVPKVLSAWMVARMFCRVPPETFTDPCAFSG